MKNFAKPVPEPAQRLTPQEEGRFLLTQHLRRLVDTDPKAAREALEMSHEHAPELYLIAQYQPASNWAQAVMNSDSLHSLMVQPRSPQEQAQLMQTLLEMDDLQSLLERLPWALGKKGHQAIGVGLANWAWFELKPDATHAANNAISATGGYTGLADSSDYSAGAGTEIVFERGT